MKKKILFVLCLLFGLMFINAGLNKLFNYIPVPEDLPENLARMNNALMEISWLMPLIAMIEIAGGVLFIIPKFRLLGALMIFPVMVGIVLTHITAAPSGLPVALILLAINIWVFIENKERLKPLFQAE